MLWDHKCFCLQTNTYRKFNKQISKRNLSEHWRTWVLCAAHFMHIQTKWENCICMHLCALTHTRTQIKFVNLFCLYARRSEACILFFVCRRFDVLEPLKTKHHGNNECVPWFQSMWSLILLAVSLLWRYFTLLLPTKLNYGFSWLRWRSQYCVVNGPHHRIIIFIFYWWQCHACIVFIGIYTTFINHAYGKWLKNKIQRTELAASHRIASHPFPRRTHL